MNYVLHHHAFPGEESACVAGQDERRHSDVHGQNFVKGFLASVCNGNVDA